MLTKIKFQNYRAFSRGEINIKPITVLVGANSVGKTSILQLPLILKQTALVSTKNYNAALKIYGREVNIGDARNLFFNKQIEKPIEIALEFESRKLFVDLTQHYFDEFSQLLFSIIEYYHFALNVSGKIKKNDKIFEGVRRVTSDSLYTDEEFEKIRKFLTESGEIIAQLPESTKLPAFGLRHYTASRFRRPLRPAELVRTVPVLEIARYFIFLKGLAKITSESFFYSAKISLKDIEGKDIEGGSRQLRVTEVTLGQRKEEILKIQIENGAITKVSSTLIDEKVLDRHYKVLDRALKPTSTIFSLFDSDIALDERYEVPELVRAIFCSAQDVVASFFEEKRLGHIGPLRAHPKRFYFLDTAEPGASEGNLLVESLRENPDLRARVNQWLSAFSLNITVAQLEEIIFRLSVRNADQEFDLDITDVGFGISQILPILVEGFISPLGKTILIEQPEIHLHPKMQAELADLFIDISNVNQVSGLGTSSSGDTKRFLVIETHSEYFLSRLRRRISEKKISHSDVSVYFVEKNPMRSGSIIKGIHMPASGEFDWPEEFYETDLEDTLAVLQNSARIAN